MTVRILQGDCRDVLKTIPHELVHCVVTSPPYWGLRDYGVPGQFGLEPTPSGYLNDLHTVFNELWRVLRKDGTVWLNLGDSYGSGEIGRHDSKTFSYSGSSKDMGDRQQRPRTTKPKDLVGIPWQVAFRLQEAGWWLRSDIIWSKPNPMPESVTDRPTKAHEYLFLLAKSERYYYDAAAIAEPADVSNWRDPPCGRDAPGQTPDAGFMKPGGRTGFLTRNKRSVWTVPTKAYDEAHFATFPPDLIEPCILAGCPEGGIVLDPFFGAGTTGLVADRHRRNCIGIELNPEYVEMARKRIFNDAPLFAEIK